MPYCHHCGRYIASGLLCEYCTVPESAGQRDDPLPHREESDGGTEIENGAGTGEKTDAENTGETLENQASHGKNEADETDVKAEKDAEVKVRAETETETDEKLGAAEGEDCPGTATHGAEAEECGAGAPPSPDTGKQDGNDRGDRAQNGKSKKSEGNGSTGFARRCRPRLKQVYEGGKRQCREALERLREIPRTPDTTATYSPHDIRRHRGMAVLCYLWVLWAVPFFRCRSSRFVRYHLGQGALLLLLDCLGMTFAGAAWLLSPLLPVVAPAAAALAEVTMLLSCGLKVFGIVTAARGCARELPILGGYGNIDG